MKIYIIQNRETGTEMEVCNTIEIAKKTIETFENEDKKNGVYEENFYETKEIDTIKLTDEIIDL